MIAVNETLGIPEAEVEYVASRSGGPGGQNVNKVSSRVTLRFDVSRSSTLTDEQRSRILKKLASRINTEGILQVTSQRTRSQDMNRADATARFAELIRAALHKEKPRVPTAISRSVQERRLVEKKKRTGVKKERSRRDFDDS